MRKAFTAIELMIVVAVLVILMGFLTPVVMKAQAIAKVKAARALINRIKVAVELYRATVGTYPTSTGLSFSGIKDFDGTGTMWESGRPAEVLEPASLYNHLCGQSNAGIPFMGRTVGPFITFDRDQLNVTGGLSVAVDPWGNPWVYYENLSRTAKKTPDVIQAHNPTTFEIFSAGPDGLLCKTVHDFKDNDSDGLVDEKDEGGDTNDDVCDW